ncbi:MAG: hypothetical protein Q4F57_02580 [Weeksellaceae bacterium]|nr:hypothetical protein [Weeksellaceae bacterium]
MTIVSLFIAVAILAACFIGIALFLKVGTKKLQTQLKELETLAHNHNAQLAEHENCGDYHIALDSTGKLLFFIMRNPDLQWDKTIDLTTKSHCKVIKQTRVSQHAEKYEIIDRLALQFVGRDCNEELEFYNSAYNLKLSGELQSIEKWNGRINQILRPLAVVPQAV